MGPLRLLVALSVFASSAVLFAQAAPSIILGPPRTLEGDTDINPPAFDGSLDGDSDSKRDTEEEVTTDERFYRVYENGTIEFKTALSNGHVQYQRISNKVVDGKTIQVYEGYVSIRYADGRYGTTYYIADENGYRRTKVEVDTKPPVLPKSAPNLTDLENDQEARSPGGTNVLAEESEAPVPPTTEGNLHPTTEENIIIPVEDTTLSVLPSTEVNFSESETTPTAGETSTSPTTEDDVKTSAEDKRIDATTVLSTTDVNKSDAVGSTDNEASTAINGNDDLPTSTQYPTLPVSEDIDKTLTRVPILEETLTTTEGGEITTDDNNEALKTTEDSSINAKTTELPISTHKTEEEGSGPINPTEDNIPISFTVAPIVEESEDLANNTELTAINDDEYLDPITETSSRKSSQEEIITTESTPQSEDIEATTLLLDPKTEAPGLLSTSSLPAINTVEIEASTELPGLEGDIKIDSAATEVPALPITEGTASDDSKNEATTELPATDGTYFLDSTAAPALPTNEANEASTELPAIFTDLPTLAISKETTTNNAEDVVIQNEASTQLPILDEASAGEELSTQTPDGPVTKSDEDDSNLSEVSTELPVDGENQLSSTESAVSSSSWPALPLVDNVSTELPIFENASVNANETVEVNKSDQLASEKTLEVSTGLPTHSEESDNITISPEEDNTATPASDENLETVAKVEEVPITEEGAIKTA